MSREIIFYADKRRNPDTRIALYWIGADAAEVLFKSLSDLSYRNNAGYIEIGKAAREMREGLDAEIEKCTDMIKEYQGFIAEYHHALINVPSVEIYHEVMNSIQEYKREIKEVQDDIEFYTKLKQTLITICNLDFLQTSYNGTPSEWELYVVYSY
jgi:succinylglutamate desuccinylase